MTVEINEHHIKSERYSLIAKQFECALHKLGIQLQVTANTEVRDVGYGPQTFVNFNLEQ